MTKVGNGKLCSVKLLVSFFLFLYDVRSLLLVVRVRIPRSCTQIVTSNYNHVVQCTSSTHSSIQVTIQSMSSEKLNDIVAGLILLHSQAFFWYTETVASWCILLPQNDWQLKRPKEPDQSLLLGLFETGITWKQNRVDYKVAIWNLVLAKIHMCYDIIPSPRMVSNHLLQGCP